jgi:hypothetical protein
VSATDDPAASLPDLATTIELAEWLGCHPQGLANNRYLGRGIPFVKLSSGRVRYLKSDVLAYLEAHRVVPGIAPREPKTRARRTG